jgi:hypothetical protein
MRDPLSTLDFVNRFPIRRCDPSDRDLEFSPNLRNRFNLSGPAPQDNVGNPSIDLWPAFFPQKKELKPAETLFIVPFIDILSIGAS